jgi:16S rRNA (uracil1498-N3)-methyltransferase
LSIFADMSDRTFVRVSRNVSFKLNEGILTMTRFFIPSDQIRDNTVILKGEDRHHLLNVLRQGLGAEITVLNGKGQEYLVKITEITSDAVRGQIVKQAERRTEPKINICLVQSLPKGDKFEFIIQKNTELGVNIFQPVISERSTIRLDKDQARKKAERWQKIIREAAEQSGRQIISELRPVQDWSHFLNEQRPPGLLLIPWEGEREHSLKQVLNDQETLPDHIAVLIGPEGGFAQSEVELAVKAGAIPVTLGPRILRTETAGLVVASALLYHFGDLE